MKVINLNESQYKRLFEMDSFVRGAGSEDLSSLPNNIGTKEVNPAAAELDGEDGDKEFAKPIGGIRKEPDGTLHKHTYSDNLSLDNNRFRNAR